MTEWYQTKILHFCNLNNVSEKKDVLTDIKIKFCNLDSRDAKQIAESLDCGPLYQQMITSNDREVIEQICDILNIICSMLEPEEIYKRHFDQISTLMNNPNTYVRLSILTIFLNIASNPRTINLLLDDTTLLISIINRIGDSSLMIAEHAMDIVKELGKNLNALRTLYKGESLRTFAKLLQNDTVSFRVYEVIVDIAKRSKEALEISAQSGFLNSLINMLDNEDVLLQLNALEILIELAEFEEGLNYLEQQEVLSKLVQKITQANENPLSNLLIPGLMTFFGKVALHWPNDLFSKYPTTVSSLFEVIDSGDQNILGPALGTLAIVCLTVEGKYALQALGDAMIGALKRIGEIIQGMPTDLRIQALKSLATILMISTVERNNRILSLTKLWFDSLCDDPLGMILAICRQPFPDIREAGLSVLSVISNQVWAQQYISTYPGLVEFLLDRNVESFEECKAIKYAIIENLSQAERGIFNAETMQKLKQFVKEGPYFVNVKTEVAVEDPL